MLIASEFRDPQNSFFIHIYGLPSFENDLCSSLLREPASCRYLLPKNVWWRCWEQSKDCIQEVSEAGFEEWSGMAEGGVMKEVGRRSNSIFFVWVLFGVFCVGFFYYYYLFIVRSYCAELLFLREGLRQEAVLFGE